MGEDAKGKPAGRSPAYRRRARAVLGRWRRSAITALGGVLPEPVRAARVSPLGAFVGLVPQGRRRTIVVLADDRTGRALAARFLQWRADDRVVLLGAPGSSNLARHAAPETVVASSADDEIDFFVHNGPVDIVVDLRGNSTESRRERWRRLFLFLRQHGSWVVHRLGPGSLLRSERAWLSVVIAGSGGGIPPGTSRVEKEALRSIGAVTARPEVVIIRKSKVHLAKLRDWEADTVVPRRDPEVSVETIQHLPAQQFASTTRVVSHEASIPIKGLETTLNVPAMSVRHFRGPLVFGGRSLLYTPNSVLAESNRFAFSDRPNNHHVLNYSDRIARIAPDGEAEDVLEGDYYHADPSSSGHFGHVMTETVARLWGWDAAKERLPDLKVLVRIKPEAHAHFERAIFSAYGIANEDIEVITRPVRVQSAVGATMMWHNWPPFFMHPDVTKVWSRIAGKLVDTTAPQHDRIFISRRDFRDRRRCRNAAEVEALFEAHGFAVIYPEDFSFRQQTGIFARPTTIAGFGGSGLFNVLFAEQLKTLIILNHEAYTARNEHLFALGLDCDVHYFWSTPDVEWGDAGFNLRAYESEWEFDFGRNRAALTDLLRSLPVG